MSFLGQSRDSLSPSINNKIEILQSNIGRVYHQHETLKSLLKHINQFLQLQKLAEISEDIKYRITTLKRDIQLSKMKTGLNKNCLSLQYGSIQNNIKHSNSQIYSIKQRIAVIHKQIQLNSKDFKCINKSKFYSTSVNLDNHIKTSKNDNKQLLNQIKAKQFQKLDEIFRTYIRKSWKGKNQMHLIQAKRQIGLLYCEAFDYKNRLLQIKKTSKNEKQQFLKTGQYQYQILNQQYSDFLFENNNRLNYQLNMMKRKLEQLKQCCRFRQQSASKKSSSNKKTPAREIQQDTQNLKQELHLLDDKMFSIQNQQRGIKKYVEQVKLKISYNQNKLHSFIQSTSKKIVRKQDCFGQENSNILKDKMSKALVSETQLLRQNQQVQNKISGIKQLIKKLRSTVE